MVTLPVDALDDVAHMMMVPYDLDRGKQIRFRVWWTQTSTTATDSVTFVLTYQAVIESDNVLGTVTSNTVMVAPATALNTVIPVLDLSTGVALQAQATGFGVINKNVLADTTAFLNIQIAVPDIGTFTADEVSIMGLEMRYTPRQMGGPEKNIRGGRRLKLTRPLSTVLATSSTDGGPQEG
jgi:hypothetical protein